MSSRFAKESGGGGWLGWLEKGRDSIRIAPHVIAHGNVCGRRERMGRAGVGWGETGWDGPERAGTGQDGTGWDGPEWAGTGRDGEFSKMRWLVFFVLRGGGSRVEL